MLYGKLISFGALPSSTTKSVSCGVSCSEVKDIIAIAVGSDKTVKIPSADISVWVNASGYLVMETKSAAYTSYTGYAIIKYTKS